MNIIDFTREYMHKNYPTSREYRYVYHWERNKDTNGYLHFNGDLSNLVMHIYNNRPAQFQAQTFMHEYHHLTQLERHGYDYQIENRYECENETEAFCKKEMPKVLRLYKQKYGIKLSVGTDALIEYYRKAA